MRTGPSLFSLGRVGLVRVQPLASGGRAVPYAAPDPAIRVTLTCSFKHLLTSLQDGFIVPVEAALGSDPVDAAVIALFVVTRQVTFEPLLSNLN